MNDSRYFKMTPAYMAFLYKEVIFLDGVRYYSEHGVAHYKPRGRYCKYLQDGEHYVFIRPKGDPFYINMMSEVLGFDDVWFKGSKPSKSSPQSVLAPFPIVEVMTGKEWYMSILKNATLVLDYKTILYPMGSFGGGHGRTDRPAMVERDVYRGDSPGMPDTYFFNVSFTNQMTDTRKRDLEKDIWKDDEVVSQGDVYDKLVIAEESEIYLAGKDFAFSNKDMAIDAAEQGIGGRMPYSIVPFIPPIKKLREDLRPMLTDALIKQGVPEGEELDRKVEQLIISLSKA